MIYFIGENMPENYGEIQKSSLKKFLAYFEKHEEISFDTETTGLDVHTDKLLSYQLGDGENQFVVEHKYLPVSQPNVKKLLEVKKLLMHNAKFDIQFLYYHNIIPTKIWDTFLAEAVLNKGKPFMRKSLDETVHRYCKLRLNKHLRGRIINEGFSARVIKYAADDTKYLLEIKEKQIQKLQENNLMKSIYLENEFVKVLAYIEYSGIYLNKEKWSKKIKNDNKNYYQAKDELNQWIIDNNLTKYIDNQLNLFDLQKKCLINWSSPKQVIPLFQSLGADTKIIDDKTGKLKDSIDAKVIEPQQDKSDLFPIYLRYKQFQKITSTYGQNFIDQIHPTTGRIHSSFNQIMVTGRLSSGNKREGKLNLQNIPANEETRSCFIAEKGNLLITADYNGQESVIFANMSEEKQLIKFYQNGLSDMHAFIASKMYPELKGLSLKEIKSKYKSKRQEAKAVGFAIQYGGNGTTIADKLNISLEEGDDLYNSYFEKFPEIKQYFKKVSNKALKLGYIQFNNITFSKSFIPYFEEFKEIEKQVNNNKFWDLYREEKSKESDLFLFELKPLVRKYFKKRSQIERWSYNYPIQGTASEISKIASIYVFNILKEKNLLFKVFFSNIIHDELILETPVQYAKELAKDVKIAMEKAGDIFCKTIRLTAEPVIFSSWKH